MPAQQRFCGTGGTFVTPCTQMIDASLDTWGRWGSVMMKRVEPAEVLAACLFVRHTCSACQRQSLAVGSQGRLCLLQPAVSGADSAMLTAGTLQGRGLLPLFLLQLLLLRVTAAQRQSRTGACLLQKLPAATATELASYSAPELGLKAMLLHQTQACCPGQPCALPPSALLSSQLLPRQQCCLAAQNLDLKHLCQQMLPARCLSGQKWLRPAGMLTVSGPTLPSAHSCRIAL